MGGMSRRTFRRWLLLNEELPWMSRRPLWQYVLLDWAIWLLTGLVVSAIIAAVVRHFPLWWWRASHFPDCGSFRIPTGKDQISGGKI
jgi:hypothetical protein